MNRVELLKKILPGLLPLFVFIIADEMWGTKIGLMIAVSSGVIESLYRYIKERRIDKFILFDTSLIVALGGVSILLDNEVFFKLKPAFIGMVFCLILGFSGFSRCNILFGGYVSYEFVNNRLKSRKHAKEE